MNGVSQIFYAEDIVLVTVRSQAGEARVLVSIFEEFAREDISIDMISQTTPHGSVMDISFTVYSPQMVDALRVISRVRDKYNQLQIMVSTGNCKIRLYDTDMPDVSGVAATALLALASSDIDILMITTSDVDISLVLPEAAAEKGLGLMKDTFQVK